MKNTLHFYKTFIFTALFAIALSQARAAVVTWTGNNVAVDMNWSDPANWSGGTPQGNAALFTSSAFPATTNVAGAVNNIVDQNTTVSSLTYNNNNSSSGFVTTFLNPGVTLMSTGSIPFVVDGIAGSTEVDTTAGMAGTNYEFIVSNYTSTVYIGGTNVANVTSAIFTLGDGTNILDMGTFDLGFSDGGNGRNSTLKLGNYTNAINASILQLGLSKATGIIEFNGPAGGLTIAGTNGPTSRASLLLGNGTSGSGASIGELLLAGGYPVNIQASTLTLGQLGNDSGNTHGVVTFDNGIFDVTTIRMGVLWTNLITTGTGNATNNSITVGGNATDTATLIVNSPSGPGGGSFLLSDNTTNRDIAGGSLTIGQNGIAELYCSMVKFQAAGNNATNVINTGGTEILEGSTDTVGTAAAPIDTLTINGTLELSVSGTASSALVCGSTVSASGATIDITSVANVTGFVKIPLISYNIINGDPFSGFTTLNVPAGYTASLTDDGAGTISLSIQPAGVVITPLLWKGTPGGTWDIGITADWKTNVSGGGAATYTNLDLVAFDDTAATGNVTLNTNVLPGSLNFTNNSINYVISGTGSIGGATLSLLKTGTASLTLSESGGDSFGSGVAVNGGTLVLDDTNGAILGGTVIAANATAQIGNSDAKGSLPSGSVTDSGSLVFDHASGTTDTVATAISGTGSLTQNGGGTLVLSGANAYTGNTTVNAGTLALTGSGTVSNSPSVIVSSAGLNLAALSSSALVNGLYLTNSTVTLALSGGQVPLVSTFFLSMGGAGNMVNITSLPAIASYPTTLMLIQTPNGIADFNMTLGSLPTASPAYTGSVSSDGRDVLLTVTGGPIGARPQTVWNTTNGVSPNDNWSTAVNWELPGAPVAADNVDFIANNSVVNGSPFGTGDGPGGITSPGNINNVVDQNFTIGSLTYTNIGGTSDSQNTLIQNGVVLNVVSNGSLTVGSGTVDFGGGTTINATIAGAGGTLNVNNTNGTVFVGEGSVTASSQQATLDLSGLGTFNASVSRLLVGVGSSSEAIPLGRLAGTLYLAQTNTITASIAVAGAETADPSGNAEAIDIGDADGNNSTQPTFLYLGQTNALSGDAIAVGRQKEVATVEFNPNLTGVNSVYFRGVSASSVGTFSIGDGVVNGGSGEDANGTCDFTTASGGTEGYVNALVNTMYVGRSANNTAGTGNVFGLLSFDNGVINVGTLYIGNQPAAAAKNATGTVNVNTNSTLGVYAALNISGSLNLGVTVSGGTAAMGMLNIGGGTVAAGSIVCGGSNSITLGNNSLGGTLIVSNSVGAPGTPVTDLNLQGGTLQLNPTYGSTNIVGGTVTISAATTINIASVATSVGGPIQISLISYTGTDPGISSLSIGTIPPGFSAASLTDDTLGHIYLNITAPPILTWRGAVGSTPNSTWDIGTTPDWFTAQTFANNDLVQFNDTASNAVVNLTTVLTPDSTTVSNNVLAYKFIGIGSVSNGNLAKQGTGSLVVDNSGANSFSSINIATGTVQVGNNDANGSLGSGAVNDSGSLVFDQTVNNTFGNAISGNGSLSQIGSGVLTVNNANTAFAGTVTVTGGILAAGNGSALGANTNVITVSSGGTLDDDGQNLTTYSNIVVSGSGANGLGAIVNNGPQQTTAFGHITLAGSATFGGTNRWDLRLVGGTLLTGGQPYSITKVGTNQVSIVDAVTVDPALSNIVITAGQYAFQELGVAGLGNNGSITVYSNAQLEIDFGDTITNATKPVVLLDGASFDCANGVNSLADPIVLSTNASGGAGNCTFTGGGTSMTWSNVVSGPGNLIKNNNVSLILIAANTYAGSTTINAGSLALTGTASIANSSGIFVNTGGIFNVSGLSATFALGAGQKLGDTAGTGIVNGNVTTGAGILSLGYTNGTPALLVTNGTLTLSSSTTVTVNNTGAQLAAGTYTLIANATGASVSAGSLPAVTVTGGGAVGATSLAISGGALNLVVASGPAPAFKITSFGINGKTLTLSAINGTDGGNYTLLETTNVTLPLSQWTPVYTNSLDGSGNLNVSTNVVTPGTKQEYYILVQP